MQCIVIDLEWNQPMGPSQYVDEPVRLNGDIIEIGAVKLDENYAVGEVYRGYVCPEFYKKMNRKVGNLTHIDPALLKDAPNFAEAWKRFMDWCGDDICFLVWGTSDMTMLRENLRVRSLPCGLPPCCDLQEVFEDQISQDGRQWALSDAMKAMRVPLLTAHDAANDAVNTARLCAHLYMDEALDVFLDTVPRVKDELIVSGDARDERVERFPCASCGKELRLGERVESADDEEGEELPAFEAQCVNCGSMHVRLYSRPLPGGKRRVVRSICAAEYYGDE